MLAIHAVANNEELHKNESTSTGITTYQDPTTEFHLEQRVRQLLGQQQPDAHPSISPEEAMASAAGRGGKRSTRYRAFKKHLTTFSVIMGHIGALLLFRHVSLKYISS
jgi:hypothetical protein